MIIEGSNDLKEGWKEYEFLYKPGDLYRPTLFIGMFMTMLTTVSLPKFRLLDFWLTRNNYM